MTALARWWFAAGLVAASACGASFDVEGADEETLCAELDARLGRSVCVHEIPDAQTWRETTFEAAAVDQLRTTTYLVAARDDSRVPTLFIDAGGFDAPQQSLHFKFLVESFPEFATLDYEEYLELTQDPTRREWYAGAVTEFVRPGAAPVFGVTVWDAGVDIQSTLRCEQLRSVWREIDARVAIGAVAIVASSQVQAEVLAGCDVPTHDPSLTLDYEPYTVASGCGTMRRYTRAELAAAAATSAFGWQDVIVVDEAPLDIETPVSGIVTGTRQAELSHLNVRSASRGTPNCYVKDAHTLLADFDGALVRLACGNAAATVTRITAEQAAECWQGLRPDPVTVVAADLDWTQLVPLLAVPTETAVARRDAVSRFGSKGANLATLYQRVTPTLQLVGFLIPFRYYDDFVHDNGFALAIGGLLGDPSFQSDGARRRSNLDALIVAMRDAPCDADLVDVIAAQIRDSFGSDDTMVRFRSSSNAEDALGFNGAGLYDSTSACLADEVDGDSLGPSHCDPDQPSERTICRALKKVWASLWNPKAYEERDWYGIAHSDVAMGILVNTRTKGELANIVAFTGNPLLRGDDRYLINAQLGELDVVASQPGVWPEKALLTVEAGQVSAIERARGSTELPAGEWVLDDAMLGVLGAHLWQMVSSYPLDEPVPPTATVLLDTEWKLRADGQLVVKQVRPFLD